MTPFRSHTLMLSALLLVASAASTGATKPTATPPPAVLKAFKVSYPNATIQRTIHEQRDGQPVVEIESVEKGMRRDLLYTPEGKMIECEETIPFEALPEPVRMAVKRELRGAKLARIERIDREGIVTFGVSVKGKMGERVFDPKGNIVTP